MNEQFAYWIAGVKLAEGLLVLVIPVFSIVPSSIKS